LCLKWAAFHSIKVFENQLTTALDMNPFRSIATLVIAFFCLASAQLNAQDDITISYIGPSPIPVGINCQTNYTYGLADFTFQSKPGCILDLSDVNFYQNSPMVGIGQTLDVTVEADDNCTLVPVTKVFKIPVTDNTPPTITVQPTPLTVFNCSNPAANQAAFQSWLNSRAGAQATDNCTPSISLTWLTTPSSPNAPTNFCTPIDVTVTFRARDFFGNITNTLPSVFRIIDNVGPAVVAPPRDTAFACDSKVNFNNKFTDWVNTLANGSAKGLDACSGTVLTPSILIDNGPEIFLPAFVTIESGACNASKTVTFVVRDKCNIPTVLGSSTFTIIDGQLPVLVSPAVNQVHNCNGTIGNLIAWNTWLNNRGGARFKDNCTDSLAIVFTTVPANPQAPKNTCSDSTIVTFTGSDKCGNSVSTTAKYYVRDNTAPVINNVPADITIYCKGNLPAVPNNVNVTDQCNPLLVLNFTQNTASGPCGPGSNITRTWSAIDSCGNATSKVQLISLIDTVPPLLSGPVPPDVTVNCNSLPLPPPLTSFFAIDDCDNNVVVIFVESTNTSVGCNGSFDLNRYWIGSDNCGNKDSLKQTITVLDNQPPVLLNKPGDITVTCANLPAPPIIGIGIIATDNCDQNVEILFSESSTISACSNKQYAITRTWLASDDCGNVDIHTQQIQVTDNDSPTFTNVPMDMTVECNNIPGVPIIGGSFKALDGCDTLVNVGFGQTNNQNPDPKDCDHFNYTIQRFWVANDDCGNVATVQQKLTVVDDSAPALFCIDTFNLPNNALSCNAIRSIKDLVFFSDGCSNLSGKDSVMQTLNLTHSGANVQISAVDTMVFNLAVQGVPANYLSGNINLSVQLENVDAEAPTEFFRIYSEDGNFIGKTNNTPNQCGNSTTNFIGLSPALVNQWAVDGAVSLILITNGSGVNAINNFCQGGKVKVSLSYDYLTSPTTSANLFYSIDNGPFVQLTTGKLDTFTLGNHKIKIQVFDCSNNVDSCEYVLNVIDDDAPSIDCPSDITAESLPTDCNAIIELPIADNIFDNCGFSSNTSIQSTPIFIFYANNGGEQLPQDIFVNFFGQPPIGNGSLKIYIKGDIAQPGEFFYVYDENNILIDSTGQGTIANECIEYESFTVPINQTQIANWSQNGVITFSLKPNKSKAIFPDLINPCGPLDGQGKDNISQVYFELVYPSFDVKYAIRDSNNIVIESGSFDKGIPNVDIPAGKYNISYILTDAGNNVGTCSFKATVFDRTPPELICKQGAIIDLNPSGLVQNKINPDDILLAAFDNCGIRDYKVTPDNISCNLSNTSANVKIVATDYSGNKDSCNTIVFFRNEPLTPTIQIDTCGGVLTFCPDTTFSQPTPGSGNFFNFSWVGPNNFFSPLPKPSINSPGAGFSGTYILTVTGLTGCQSSGSVNINIDQDGLFRPTVSSNTPICQGDSITLFTDWVGALSYTWVNAAKNIQFITVKNSLTLSAQTIYSGLWTVKAGLGAGCASATSNPHNVTVNLVGVVTSDTTSVCSGEKAILDVDAINGSVFIWYGPNGEIYSGQNPEVPSVPGIYIINVTNSSGCVGIDSTLVLVGSRPNITAISQSCPICATGNENCSIEPSVFPLDQGNYLYEWFNPTNTLFSNNVNAELNNITGTNGGNYTLFVTDLNTGCRSLPSTIFIPIKNTPATPLIELDTISTGSPEKICEGEQFVIKFQTQAPSGSSITYIWDTPLGKVITAIPSLKYTISNINNAGFYSVQVVNDGCPSNISNQIFVEVNPIPFPPLPTIESPICEGDTLNLETDLIAGATYEWVGPTGVFSTLQNPFITGANPGDNGEYRVRITLAGCTSLYSGAVTATIKPRPQAPVLVQDCGGSVCIDEPNQACLIYWIAPNAPSGATFNLYSSSSVLLAGQIGNDSLLWNTFPLLGTGSKQIYGTVTADGCESLPGSAVQIQVDSIPNILADAGNNLLICESAVLNACADQPLVGTGAWSYLSGVQWQLQSPSTACTPITGFTGGEQSILIWNLSNGGCKNYSSDTILIEISAFIQASAEQVLNFCAGTPIILQAGNPQGNWTQSLAQSQLGVSINNPSSPNTNISNLPSNQVFSFSWQVDNGACGISEATTTVNVFEDAAFAGQDRLDCGLGCLKDLLLANTPAFGSGEWSALDPGIFIENPDNPLTGACGLKDGSNIFVWTTNNGICGKNSIDTLFINYQFISKALPDTLNIGFGGAAFLDVLTNDSLYSDFSISISKLPQYGNVNDLGNGKWVYSANPNYIGQDFVTYTLCSVLCPDQCTEANLVVNIGGEVFCKAPTIITPNGDNVNDSFIIPCLALVNEYPNNSLAIFNQWGDEIFQAAPYDNTWAGTYQGQDLPAGTYFFIMDLGDGTKPQAGFLLIKK